MVGTCRSLNVRHTLHTGSERLNDFGLARAEVGCSCQYAGINDLCCTSLIYPCSTAAGSLELSPHHARSGCTSLAMCPDPGHTQLDTRKQPRMCKQPQQQMQKQQWQQKKYFQNRWRT